MMLKIKQRKSIPKKVLIYGLDGSGKSTFAEQYCKDNNLNAVCLDVDDTNFTSVPLVEFDRTNHLKVKQQVLDFIADVKASDDFDTIIIDGVSSLLNLLVSDGRGLNKYGDRTVALNKIINELARSRQNFILVGQIDLDTAKDDVSVAVVNVNSIVNEKYYCYIDDKGNYLQEVKKFRSIAQMESQAKNEPEIKEEVKEAPKPAAISVSPKEIANSIFLELPRKDITTAKIQLLKLVKDGILNDEECPKVLEELEALLC